MKKFISVLLVAIAMIALALRYFFEWNITYVTILDAMFVVGLFMFFMGILTVSNASDVFLGSKYVFLKMFKYQESKKFDSFYDYYQEKKSSGKKKDNNYGPSVVAVGLLLILISVILPFFTIL